MNYIYQRVMHQVPQGIVIMHCPLSVNSLRFFHVLLQMYWPILTKHVKHYPQVKRK